MINWHLSKQGIPWPVSRDSRGLKVTAHWGHVFFEVDRWPMLVFDWIAGLCQVNLCFRAVQHLTTLDETGHTKRNRFVVIIPKTSVKTEWGEFEVTTKCVNFLTQAKHMRCADNMNQNSTIVLVNERIHGHAPAVCPYSIRIFQVYVTVVHVMNTWIL